MQAAMKPPAIHLVLTLRDGTTGTYLWSESLTLTLKIGTSQQNLVPPDRLCA